MSFDSNEVISSLVTDANNKLNSSLNNAYNTINLRSDLTNEQKQNIISSIQSSVPSITSDSFSQTNILVESIFNQIKNRLPEIFGANPNPDYPNPDNINEPQYILVPRSTEN